MMPTLLYLPHSPWSLKALCALRHHRLAVTAVAYRPFLDEPALRLRLLRAGSPWRGRVSVPILFASDEVARSSWEVARYADRHGSGASLIPAELLSTIERWDTASERILEAGRARFMPKVLSSEAALREVTPPPLARMPATMLRGSIRMFNAKYGIRADGDARYAGVIAAELEAVRAALAGGKPYLLGERFSYADIAIALGLQVLRPLPHSGFGPVSEQLAGDAQLAERFADLVVWRDQLHARHPLVAG